MLSPLNNRLKSRIISSPLIISGVRHCQRRAITTSRAAHSPALAIRRKGAANTTEQEENARVDVERSQMRDYLRNRDVVVLPSPMPTKVSYPRSDGHYLFFPDTPSLDKLAIMEACLTGYLDVRRAHQLFNDAMEDPKLLYLLDTKVHNSFLRTYIEYALHLEEQGDAADFWRKQFWALYKRMDQKGYQSPPNANTYTVMLFGMMNSPELSHDDRISFTTKLLRAMEAKEIALSDVVAQSHIADESGRALLEILSESAKQTGSRAQVMQKLESIGIVPTSEPNILDGVAEVIPQTKRKVVKREIDGQEEKVEIFETPYNLGVLRGNLKTISESRQSLPDDIMQRQKMLEETAYDSALARFKHESDVFRELDMGGNLNNRSLQAWMWDWHVQTQPCLQARIKELEEQEKASSKELAVQLSYFLKLLPAEKLVLITILELVNTLATGGYQDGVRTTRLIMTIGRAIEAEHHFQAAKKKQIPILDFKSKAELPTYSVSGYLELHKARVKARLEIEGKEDWMPPWTPEVRARVGAFVVDTLMEQATVINTITVDDKEYEEDHPAFFNTYRYERGFKIGVIKANDVVIQKMSQEPPREHLHPRHLPMLVRPQPWIRHNTGGYLFSNLSVMRMKESNEQNSYLKEADSRGAMELVYAGLDVLGKTPWKINRDLFDVALEVWNKGLGYPGIPPLALEQTIPDPPTNPTDLRAKADYAVAMKRLAQERSAHHSDRCSTNYKMEIARTFLGEKFYFPHNIDFRGRAYPIPPHLNHIGDDLSRGLLMFAEGKPLGQRGIRWLKIHLSNLFGYDKAPFDDRENFATEHLSEIYDSAENPLEGRQWWLKADDPWQCLATCMELRKALESPDPEKYESCLPVHQDGTCNGLQHYAALGGDVTGARQVNLDVTDRPSDVYTYVSEMAKAQINKDAAEGNKFAQMLQGRVNRKIVKQTVMTTVYGVTFIGARDQIHRQLKAIDDFEGMDLYPYANYLAKVVLDCIGTLFKGAKDIQVWLNDCARLITKSIPEDRVRLMFMAEQDSKALPPDMKGRRALQWQADLKGGQEQMTTVVWTTLLGLPIVQPYRKAGRKQILTQLQSVYISDPNQPQAVNTSKQVSAFPPNFVHSLDASHMMLTALQCDRQGLTFAAVHDSYWTHASSIDDMSVAIRDSFVHLHSSHVLESLLKEFKERYQGYKLPVSAFTSRVLRASLVRGGRSPAVERVLSTLDHGKEELEEEEDKEVAEMEVEEVEEVEEEEKKPRKAKKAKATASKMKAKDVPLFDPEKKRSRREEKEIEEKIAERFIDLVDVLPPIPQKGMFNIEIIKDSPYFFS